MPDSPGKFMDIAEVARRAAVELNNAAVLSGEDTWRTVRVVCADLELLAAQMTEDARHERMNAEEK